MTRNSRSRGSLARLAAVSAGVGVGVAAIAALGVGIVAIVFARAVVTPPKTREQDVRILEHDATTVTVSANLDSLTPGSYSLWFSGDTGHARVGEILHYDIHRVTRQLLAVDFGDLDNARRGRLGGWYYLSPAELGYAYSDIEIDTELGPAPAWLIPAAEPSERWMIGVHGRAVRRQETLRSVPVFREAGFTSLLVSYRNDGDAPATADNRYALGDSEWRDVESAIEYAIDHGAKEIVLMGWSMGGAIVLQALMRSQLSDRVIGVALESPVVDWVTALQYQGVAYRLPPVARQAVLTLLSSRHAKRLTGQSVSIDFARMNLVARSGELHTPILILHSDDDGYVPSTASRALAQERPDLVTFDWFTTARHTKLWNYDRDRWNADISSWLRALPERMG